MSSFELLSSTGIISTDREQTLCNLNALAVPELNGASPSLELETLLYARSRLALEREQFARILNKFENEAPPKLFDTLPTRGKPDMILANRALLHLELGRAEKQTQRELADKLGVTITTYRSVFGRMVTRFAEECFAQNAEFFRDEVKQLDAAIRLHVWDITFNRWIDQSAPQGLKPQPTGRVPFIFLRHLDGFSTRVISILDRELICPLGEHRMISLIPFEDQSKSYYGYQIESQGHCHGTYVTALRNPDNGKIFRLKELGSGPVLGLQAEKISLANGMSGELTKLLLGVGPFKFDQAFGHRQIVTEGTPYVTNLSWITTERPQNLLIPKAFIRNGITHISHSLTPESLEHLATQGNLVGACLLINGHRTASTDNAESQKEPGVPLMQMKITRIDARAISFEARALR